MKGSIFMKRAIITLFATVLALSGLGLPTSAAAEASSDSPVLARVVSSGTLRVGMSGNQPPLNFKGKDGTLMGLEVDLAGAIAALMDAKLEIVQKPFGELLGALQKGEVDLVMSGMTITAERNMKVAFVGPYYLSGKSILTRSTALAQADETEDLDLADLKLAALEGSTSQNFVEVLLPKATLVTTKDYDEAVKLILADEVQALVADHEIVALTALLHPKENLVTLARPLTIEPIGVAVPPGDALLLNFLENTFGALEASDILGALRSRWLQQGDWVQQLP
jgi:polar amino acid transport system substrate-binding protein